MGVAANEVSGAMTDGGGAAHHVCGMALCSFTTRVRVARALTHVLAGNEVSGVGR